MSELKPCPFCGGDSVTLQSLGNRTRAGCVDCGAEVTRQMGLYKNAMIEWNTRPIEDELQKRIAELEAERRWIPVSERLPEDGKPVWVCTIWNEQHSGFLIDGVWGGLFRDFREGEVTYWMSLPELPEESKKW